MPTRLTSFPVSREGEVKDWEAGSRPKCLIRRACEGVKAKRLDISVYDLGFRLSLLLALHS
jgi:hypothetical protein